MTNKEKKELANVLYMTGEMSQKEIAERVGTSEQSLSAWVTKGEWDKLRQAKLVTKDKLIARIYADIDGTLDKDDEEIVYTEGGKPKVKKNRKADEVIKLAKAVSYLQNDRLMLPHVLQTFKMFNNFIETLPSTIRQELIDEITISKNVVKTLVRAQQLFLEEDSKKLMY